MPGSLLQILLLPLLQLCPQDWLASSARKAALAGRPMEWQTPLGLPVVQPYHKRSSKMVGLQFVW